MELTNSKPLKALMDLNLDSSDFVMLGFGCLRGVSDVSNNGEIDVYIV
jgi:hypothetical protein